MADGSGSGSGGVPGAGGVTTPPRNLADSVGSVPPTCTPGTVGCPDKHMVRAELRYVDDNSGVPWAKGAIMLSSALAINSGPLTMGAIESRDIPAGLYSVIFTEIDAKEWWEG